ncbi:MAG TPA: PEGA domain-containing protein, partial [Flavobacteriales bacterium]|nr:PEGA domain-containing protein [Flavobacteriales bacterium]
MRGNVGAGVLCLLAAAPLWVGCASVLSKEKNSVRINSVPSGASVHVNGSPRGTTPFDYVYSPDDGEQVTVELRQTGYRNASFTLDAEQNSGVLFVDAMLLHIPYIVDKDAPQMNRMPVSEHTVEMYREAPEDQVHYLIPVVAMDIELGDHPVLGTCSSKAIKMDKEGLFRDLGFESGLSSNVVTALRDSWMDAHSVQLGNSKATETVQRAKLLLRPVLRSMLGTLTEHKGAYYGTVEVEMEWRFFSGLHTDSLLFTLPLRSTIQCLGAHRSEIISNALQHAARRLADDPEL